MKLRDADAARLLRMAGALRETAAAAARLSPDWADDARWVAEFLADMTATRLGAAPSQTKRSHRRDLPAHGAALHAERVAITAAWYRHRVAAWPNDQAPPTLADDWRDAQRDRLATGDGRPVPRRFVRQARWPGWKRPAGRPPKSAAKV